MLLLIQVHFSFHIIGTFYLASEKLNGEECFCFKVNRKGPKNWKGATIEQLNLIDMYSHKHFVACQPHIRILGYMLKKL